MGLFHKYLDAKDKEEFRLRQQQINEQAMIVEGLKQLTSNWFAEKVIKYGLDPQKNWSVNPISGQISEVKKEPKA